MKQPERKVTATDQANALSGLGADRTALLSSLTSLNQQGAAQLSAASVALERCRLAAEWKQAVEEQGLAITFRIRSSMRELFSQINAANHKDWPSLAYELGMADMSDRELFEHQRETLIRDVENMVQAHLELGDSVVRMASLLVEVEACSERVVHASDRICANGLVVSRGVFKPADDGRQ